MRNQSRPCSNPLESEMRFLRTNEREMRMP